MNLVFACYSQAYRRPSFLLGIMLIFQGTSRVALDNFSRFGIPVVRRPSYSYLPYSSQSPGPCRSHSSHLSLLRRNIGIIRTIVLAFVF